jgi:MYXO-CTERM domain-containing protein
MRFTFSHGCAVGLAASLLGLPSAARAAKLVVVGDSWAEQSADELEAVLVGHGQGFITVDPNGIGGTTADQWANVVPNALVDLVALNPDAEWVWLSIGGNDLFANYTAGLGAQNADIYETNLRQILTTLWASYPDIKVVMFGYDFVNFEQSPECISQALVYFGPVATADINQYMVDDVHGVQQQLAAEFPNLTHVHEVLGTLQSAGGIPGAPNILFPSPSQYMNDCIHPTSQGYSLIHEVLWLNYWGLPEPTAQITTDDATVCVGETATFEFTGEGEAWWSVDAQLQASGPSFELLMDSPGIRLVELEVHNGAWTDSTSMQVTAEASPVVELQLPATVVVGQTIEVEASADVTANFTWEVEGGGLVMADGGVATLRWDSPGTYAVTANATTEADCLGQAQAQIEVEPDPGGGSDTGGSTDTGLGGDGETGTGGGTGGLGGLDSGGAAEGCACRSSGAGEAAPASLLGLLALAGALTPGTRRRRRRRPGAACSRDR